MLTEVETKLVCGQRLAKEAGTGQVTLRVNEDGESTVEKTPDVCVNVPWQ